MRCFWLKPHSACNGNEIASRQNSERYSVQKRLDEREGERTERVWTGSVATE